MPEFFDVGGNSVGNSLAPPPSLISPDQIQSQIRQTAIKKGVDPDFALAVAKQESSFNPHATSPKGAQGLFQLMPETAKNYGVNDSYDPQQNINGGVQYLADLQKKHQGDKYKTLVEYNSGPKNVDKSFEQLPDETQGYVTNILGQNAATTHGSPKEFFDMGGNPVDISKSKFLPKPLTSQQAQAGRNLNATYTPISNFIDKSAEYAPLILGAAGGAVGSLVDAPNVGAGIGSGLGELVAGSVQHGVPNKDDLKNALEGGLSSFALGKAFSLPGALKRQVTKGIVNKAGKSANILEDARQDLTGGISSGSTQNESDVLKAKLSPVKAEEEAKWEKVNSRMDKSQKVIETVNGQEGTGVIDPNTGKEITRPKIETTTIRGPVKISNETLDYINSTKAQIADAVQKFQSPQLIKAYQSLNNAAKAVVTDKDGNTYLPFDASKQLRTDIGAITSQEGKINLQSPNKSIGLQRGGGVLTGLRDKLGSDIEDTLTDMGPDALKEYGDAVGMTKTRVKASLFDKVISKNTNEGTGMLNVDKAINDFKNPTSPFSKEFSASERNSITGALEAVRNTSPQYDGALKYGAQGPGKFIFYSAYAAAHPLKFAVAITSKDLFEKVLSQPKYARILAQLPSAPAKSTQANMLTKSLMKGALKSVPAEMIAPSGMKITKAHIDENGEPKPDFQLGAQ